MNYHEKTIEDLISLKKSYIESLNKVQLGVNDNIAACISVQMLTDRYNLMISKIDSELNHRGYVESHTNTSTESNKRDNNTSLIFYMILLISISYIVYIL